MKAILIQRITKTDFYLSEQKDLEVRFYLLDQQDLEVRFFLRT